MGLLKASRVLKEKIVNSYYRYKISSKGVGVKMKRILITGKDSYIGTSLENWLGKNPDKYIVNTVDMKESSWKENDFSEYDAVLHVAGIAHVSSDPKMENVYYKVNRDLTIETAKKAKAEGVRQFIFMSSIIVYGDSSSVKRVIDRETVPTPSNFYGNSKLQAEKGIAGLESDEFKIVILRPPMIYGKGSKGNYPRLAKMAKKIPVFPDIDNERSMLHIDNLCEFIRLMIEDEASGLFFPQNEEYVKTSELVVLIAGAHGKKVKLVRAFNSLLRMLGLRVGLINKVFGNLVYEKSMSEYKHDYQIRNLHESIELTEK
jgi:UDP-glucose 4-epimerase